MKTKNELIKEFCLLHGKEFKCISKHSCTGKWSGTTDYCIVFSDDTRYFVSNGMKYFNEKLQSKIDEFNYLQLNKNKLKEKIAFSLDLDVNSFDLIFDKELFFVCIFINGLLFTETNFSFFCKYGSNWDYTKKRTLLENFYLQKN